ncbi:MAG: hypothetical protein COU22_00795 [Candidatus Komeilibacteria bacterium CG10_big_fil_rev_8_21_14_0_10_41_13]|uniref:Uncharacterized protein n=1 Tax=Candidatus Komeilibacteria bacterium CG10_big_fil_rev_8_21_14_0_10_41_13 TaxID=1974476 RepID=A0A2M6WD32_9BACT|nr:MAG: hypothetical protein COU22_00795 [Candidatus Komeilibacteria bacterium CG10_big_fil_rev_8_21_14_0_10_41_13]
MIKVYLKVLAKPGYLILALVLGGLIAAISLWLPNWQLLKLIFQTDQFALSEKLAIFFSGIGIVKTGFSLWDRLLLIIISCLGGFNLSLIVYYFKARSKALGGLGLIGLVSGLVGLGCLSCGSVVLSAIFGLTMALGLMSYLPFGGAELAVLGVGFLLLSIYLIGKKLASPLTCEIKESKK